MAAGLPIVLNPEGPTGCSKEQHITLASPLHPDAVLRIWTANIRKEVAASKRHSAPELRYLETRDQVAQAANPTTGLGSLTVPLIAMHYLQRERGREPLLYEYWRQVPRSADWQTAFATAFGLTVGQFYEQFEAYRTTL